MGRGTFLLGYDVEHTWGEDRVTEDFLQVAVALHEQLKAPATFYVVGQLAERHAPWWSRLAEHPLFALGQHTDSHRLIKTLCQENDHGVTVMAGASVDEVRAEVGRASEALEKVSGRRPLGFTAPYTYYRGLMDRPDLLSILQDHGIRYLRSFGRNCHDWQPRELNRQPFWYDAQGYPAMLELMIHGWMDCLWRDEMGWDDRTYVAMVFDWLERASAQDAVFSYCQHDWSSIRDDPSMEMTRAIVLHAQSLGMRILTGDQYYQERRTTG